MPAPAVLKRVFQEGATSAHRAPGSSWNGMEVTILGKDNFSLSDDKVYEKEQIGQLIRSDTFYRIRCSKKLN
jgi:hypothetical protein